MLLKPATEASVAGTGTTVLESRILGGVLITADGTNNAVVTLRKDNSAGRIIYQITTKSPLFTTGPISIRDSNVTSQTIYYDVSGTGASAMLYEWVE
jgi:hypothetical protein